MAAQPAKPKSAKAATVMLLGYLDLGCAGGSIPRRYARALRFVTP